MERFVLKQRTRNNRGFTLIEVLIALAIIAIALTAVMKSTSLSIRNHIYLQNKTIALWVAEDVINQTRVGLLQLSDSESGTENQTMMFNQAWSWKAWLKPTANAGIQEIDVEVFEKDSKNRLIKLTGYMNAKTS